MTDPATPPLVDLSRDIEATPETVWSILTTPERFSMWMDGNVDFEARVGSAFRAEFPNFQTVVAGEIVTLDHDARHLGVTWGVESGPQAEAFPAGCSLVEFRVSETDTGCRVDLTHSRLPSTAEAMEHEGGWRFHLSRMALHANRSDLAIGLERTLGQWFEAWNEPDVEKRMAALEACCSEDVEFRDEWAVASGRDLLNTHISNCLMFVPGWEIEATGDVRIARGEALVGWRSTGPGGVKIEGFNHVRASHDGTIRRVAGFAAAPDSKGDG